MTSLGADIINVAFIYKLAYHPFIINLRYNKVLSPYRASG